jgi:hypothetical protein
MIEMKRWIAVFAVLPILVGPLEAAGPMNEQRARTQAIEILMGDPYGTTKEEVSKTIKQTQLIADGQTLCGRMKGPVWRFHVMVDKPVNNPDSPIDGFLFLDATSGKIVCANLPMLDQA